MAAARVTRVVSLAALLWALLIALCLPSASAGEKKRVPRPDAPPTRTKEEPKKQEEKDDDDTSCFEEAASSCFDGILTGLFESICSSFGRARENPSPSEEPPPPPAGTPSDAARPVPQTEAWPDSSANVWQAGEMAVLLAPPGRSDVVVWSTPSQSDSDQVQARMMPDGARVKVVEVRSVGWETWLKVTSRDAEPVTGWILETEAARALDRTTAPPGTRDLGAVAGPRASSDVLGRARPEGPVLLANISWARASGPFEVREEYRDGGVGFGLDASWVLPGRFQFGLGLGYQVARGYPEYAYETDSLIDVPERSQLSVFDLGLRGGQYVASGRARFSWSLGPALYWVEEKADITERDTLLLATGTREESLRRVRLGGDVTVAALWRVGDSGCLGLRARFFCIPWSSRPQKSLTTDFLDRRTLNGFELGLALGVEP